MTALLITLAAVVLLAVLACAAGIGVVVAPFVLSVDMAERRELSAVRWGGASLLGIAVALALALVVHDLTDSKILAGVVLAVAWAVPGALALTGPGPSRVGGMIGAHER